MGQAGVPAFMGDRSASGCKSHANKVKPKLSRGLCLGQGAILFNGRRFLGSNGRRFLGSLS